jgi:hypothetical protein
LLSSKCTSAAAEGKPWTWAFDKVMRGSMCSVSTSQSFEDDTTIARPMAHLQPREGSRGSSSSSGSTSPSHRSGEESDPVGNARRRHYGGKGMDLNLDDIIETCNAVSHNRHLSPRTPRSARSSVSRALWPSARAGGTAAAATVGVADL